MSSQLPKGISPTDVRVTLKDGSRFEVKDLHAFRDTLYGYVKEEEESAIALQDIVEIEERHPSPLKTGAAVFGGLVIVAGVAYLVNIAYGLSLDSDS